jgi:hypothetical protein
MRVQRFNFASCLYKRDIARWH